MNRMQYSGRVRCVVFVLAAVTFAASTADYAIAGGCTYRNGVGARARGAGGAGATWASDALGAMAENPAALARLTQRQFGVNLTSATTVGSFANTASSSGVLNNGPFFLPEGAYAQPIGSTGLVVGGGVVPEMMLNGNWEYDDPPGAGAGATYGFQQKNDSEFLLLRYAGGVGYNLSDRISIGGNVGLVYNRNHLEMPYIFQSEPTLKGLKTLLDLRTSGYAADACAGTLIDISRTVHLSAVYKSGNSFTTRGTAVGDASAQFQALGVDAASTFDYEAEVNTHSPQIATLGLGWEPAPRLALVLQWEWLDWSGAMPDLPVALTNGNNAVINSLLNSTSLNDVVPFRWRDRYVYRVGGEYALTDRWYLRSGYAFSPSAVPDSTLTPLTADITENTVTWGVGYHRGRHHIDAAYQWDLTKNRTVGQSGMAGGEYSGSRTQVGLHWITISSSLSF